MSPVTDVQGPGAPRNQVSMFLGFPGTRMDGSLRNQNGDECSWEATNRAHSFPGNRGASKARGAS